MWFHRKYFYSEPTLLTASIQKIDSFPDFVYVGDYNNQHIYFHQNGLTWDNARQKCLDNGGDLLIIRDSVENNHFINLTSTHFQNNIWWIGLYQDLNDINYSEPGGGWKWALDGTYATYTPWGSLDNNFGGTEHWGNFTQIGLWNDYNVRPLSFVMVVPFNQHFNQITACNGGNDGSTYVTAAGGTTPYTYLWNDPNAETTDTAYNLAAGDYLVTVTDANGCTAKDTATITQPELITGLDSITACDTYTWIDGNTYAASNNTILIP